MPITEGPFGHFGNSVNTFQHRDAVVLQGIIADSFRDILLVFLVAVASQTTPSSSPS